MPDVVIPVGFTGPVAAGEAPELDAHLEHKTEPPMWQFDPTDTPALVFFDGQAVVRVDADEANLSALSHRSQSLLLALLIHTRQCMEAGA